MAFLIRGGKSLDAPEPLLPSLEALLEVELMLDILIRRILACSGPLEATFCQYIQTRRYLNDN
jgi:hypothetical protein